MMSDLLSSSTTSLQQEPHPEVAIVDSSAVLVSANDTILDTNNNNNTNEDDARKQRHEALRALVSERLVVERTPEEDEMVDPIERAVRFLVPIPKQYYWDATEDETDWTAIPTHIKVWHRMIAGSVAVGEWTSSHVAQPVASALGLTSSRFHFVTDQMTPQDMEQSRRMVQERKLRQQEMQQMSTGQEGDAV